MQLQRTSLSKILSQMELNKFYERPVARVSANLIFSVVCVAFFGLIAIRPTLITMSELIKQIEEKKELDQQLLLKINALAVAQKELSSKEPILAVLDTATPPTPKFTEIVRIIEKIAAEQALEITSLQTSALPVERDSAPTSAQETNIESIPFSMVLSGPFEKLQQYVVTLENLQRIIIVDRVELTPQSDEDNTKLTMTVAARAFALSTTNSTRTLFDTTK